MKLSQYDKECIEKAKTLIDKDASQHYTIDTIATKAHIGRTKLKYGFKLIYDKGIYEYLREERMKLALMMLENEETTLKKIARKLGFKYVNNFIVAFKKRYNTTPYKWRTGNRKNDANNKL